MSLYSLKTTREIKEQIAKLHPDIKKKIKQGILRILSDPDSGKNLKDDLKGLRSYRVGKFRIIYRTTKTRILELIAIGPRRIIYEETLKIIGKK